MSIATKMNCTYISTPYVATPSSPRKRISCALYSIPISEPEMLLISSDEPLAHDRSSGCTSNSVQRRRRGLLLLNRKYISGTTPPTVWLMPVAIAAPAMPQRNTPTNSASSTMFVTPAASVISKPNFGRSAAIRNDWNMFCSMNDVRKQTTIRP